MKSLFIKVMRILSSLFILSSFLFQNTIYANEVSTHIKTNNETNILNIGYKFLEDSITESSTLFINNEIIYMDIVVHKNGNYEIVLKDNGGNQKNIHGKTNYSEFRKMAIGHNENLLKSKKDIKGKQFKHQEIGSNTFTVDRDEFISTTNTLALIAELVSEMLGVPSAGKVALVISGIVSAIAQGDPDYVEIEVTTYEVLFTNDNSYYTHCYHSIIKSYKYGRLQKTQRDYTQVIGG